MEKTMRVTWETKLHKKAFPDGEPLGQKGAEFCRQASIIAAIRLPIHNRDSVTNASLFEASRLYSVRGR